MHEMSQHFKDLNATALQVAAMANRTQLITDILSSASQFFDKSSMTFLPAARFLIWPLTVVTAIAKERSELARQHAIKCLYDIAIQARIPQASQAARAIESGSSLDWWVYEFPFTSSLYFVLYTLEIDPYSDYTI